MKNNRLKKTFCALALIFLLMLGLLVSCDGCNHDDSAQEKGDGSSEQSESQSKTESGYGDTTWFDIPFTSKK